MDETSFRICLRCTVECIHVEAMISRRKPILKWLYPLDTFDQLQTSRVLYFTMCLHAMQEVSRNFLDRMQTHRNVLFTASNGGVQFMHFWSLLLLYFPHAWKELIQSFVLFHIPVRVHFCKKWDAVIFLVLSLPTRI